MEGSKLSPPWYGYVNKLKALFGRDEEITIKYNEETLTVSLYIDNTDKYEALKKLLPETKDFGGTILKIDLIPADKENEGTFDYFIKAFKNNPVVADIQEIKGVLSNPIMYVSFEKKVVQYYDDNLGDINGNRSTLLEQLAREVFNDVKGVYFCTDNEGFYCSGDCPY